MSEDAVRHLGQLLTGTEAQQLADLFFWLGFIPTEVDVAAATLPGLETFAT